MIIYTVWLTTAAIKILIDYSYTIYRRFTMNKDTLLNALNDYLLHIQLDPIGDITSKINAVEACRNYVAAIDGDVVNADWVKSNCIIILPAIDYQRKALKRKYLLFHLQILCRLPAAQPASRPLAQSDNLFYLQRSLFLIALGN